MGVVFLPFLIGVGVLFYDSSKKWGWWLAGLGLAMLVVEMVSRIHFRMEIKSSTFLLMFCLIAAGAGLVTRGLLMNKKKEREGKVLKKNKEEKSDEGGGILLWNLTYETIDPEADRTDGSR